MPALEIDTNVPQWKITPTLVTEMTTLMSQMLGLDRKFMAVIFRVNPAMTWGGTAEPCAFCRLTAINDVDEQHNKNYAAKLFGFMGEKLGVPGDRMYTVFTNPAASHVGYTGKLFSELQA